MRTAARQTTSKLEDLRHHDVGWGRIYRLLVIDEEIQDSTLKFKQAGAAVRTWYFRATRRRSSARKGKCRSMRRSTALLTGAGCSPWASRSTCWACPKAIREQIGKGPGDIVSVALWKDEQPREVDVPPVFKALMKKAGVLPFFENLSFTNRKEYCRWITEAKKEETRTRRLEKALEMLKKECVLPG